MRRTLLPVGTAVVCALPWITALATDGTDDTLLTQAVSQFEQWRHQTWQEVWGMQRLCAFASRDLLGRDCSELLRQTVLTATEVEKLTRIRSQIDQQVAAANLDGARVKVSEALQSLQEAGTSIAQFTSYRQATEALEFHRHLWQVAALVAVDSERSRSVPIIAAAETAYVKELQSAPNLLGAIAHWQQLRVVYEEERVRLTASSAAAARLKLRSWSRDTPCPPPTALRGGTHTLSLARSDVSLFELYPVAERNFQVEGTSIVEINIDADGCLQSAAIRLSTGSPALDDAAIAFVAHASFIPREDDGVPSPTSARLPINFRLKSMRAK
jgi:TonB family protein